MPYLALGGVSECLQGSRTQLEEHCQRLSSDTMAILLLFTLSSHSGNGIDVHSVVTVYALRVYMVDPSPWTLLETSADTGGGM